jgi:hypothetical protein
MRTTLSIDDDVLSAAREMAVMQKRALGDVISAFARRGLIPIESSRRTRNGVPLLAVRAGSKRVTSEVVYQLQEGPR